MNDHSQLTLARGRQRLTLVEIIILSRPHEAVGVDDASVWKRQQVCPAVSLPVQVDWRLEWMEVGASTFAISVVVDFHYPADRVPRSRRQFNNSFTEIFQITKIRPRNRGHLGFYRCDVWVANTVSRNVDVTPIAVFSGGIVYESPVLREVNGLALLKFELDSISFDEEGRAFRLNLHLLYLL